MIEQTTQPCPKCGESTVHNANFCHTCGYPLKAILLSHTRLTLATESIKIVETADLNREPTPFPKNGQVVLKLGQREINQPANRRFILGRKSDTGPLSLVDLTPYGGWENGVSRDHASIHLGTDGFLKITDLSSANGTFINGKKLRVLQPYPLRDGDEICLAELKMTIHFHAPQEKETTLLDAAITTAPSVVSQPQANGASSATPGSQSSEVASRK